MNRIVSSAWLWISFITCFEALLFEVAAIVGAGKQRPAMSRAEHRASARSFRHVAIDDLSCETLGDGSVSPTPGIANQQWIVLLMVHSTPMVRMTSASRPIRGIHAPVLCLC